MFLSFLFLPFLILILSLIFFLPSSFQDERYSKYVGKEAIVPLTFGRHVPIISDRVEYVVLLLFLLT